MAIVTKKKQPLNVSAPPLLTGILSLIIPGLGQIVGRQIYRGILLLGSLVSIAGLFAWRIQDLAHREPTAWDKFTKALDRRPAFVLVVLIFLILLWLWIAWDAYTNTKEKRKGGSGVFIIIIAAFFTLGLQISQVDIVKAVTELPDAWPPLSKVLWPWEAATCFTNRIAMCSTSPDPLRGWGSAHRSSSKGSPSAKSQRSIWSTITKRQRFSTASPSRSTKAR